MRVAQGVGRPLILVTVLAVPYLRAVPKGEVIWRCIGLRLTADVEHFLLHVVYLPVSLGRVGGLPVSDLGTWVVDDVNSPVQVDASEMKLGHYGCLLVFI